MYRKIVALFMGVIMIAFANVNVLSAAETADASELLASIVDVAPAVSENGDRLILPKVSNTNYTVELFGSSNEAVIGLDGTVYPPLEDMTVSVMYRVVCKNNPDDFAIDHFKEVEITIPGRYTASAADNARPSVVPGIREWKGHTGNFSLTSSSRIVVENPALEETAEQIAFYFEQMLGRDLPIVTGPANPGDLVLSLDELPELGEEGYEVEIADQVIVRAHQPKGVLYAGVTLTQILNQDSSRSSLPKGLIRDYPQYEVRACMLDVARFYMPLDYLGEITRYMAYFKLNEIRLHINDNGGENDISFRVESKRYPQINSGLSADEVYSQEDYRAYQKDALKYGIEVVTEIDTPAHAGFVKLARPDLSMDGFHMDLSKEDAIPFIESLFDEFLDGDDPVVQSTKFHIGTDEYDTAYSELVRAYMDELITYVNNKGYETRFWASLGGNGFVGNTPVNTDATAHFWGVNYADFTQMIEDGYGCINNVYPLLYIVPGAGTFRDYLDIAWMYDTWEATIFDGGFTLPAAHPQMMGSESALWYDYKTGMSEFDYFDRLYTQIMLMSEKNWCGEKREGQTGEEFLERIDRVDDYAPGANPARFVESEEECVARYDFESVEGDVVQDGSSNGYDAFLHELELVENNGGHALRLDGQGYLSLPFDALGFPYTAQFDLYVEENPAADSVLFHGRDGTMYLNYQGTGKIGYERKGYAYVFDYDLYPGMWHSVTLSCTASDATLSVGGVPCASGVYYHMSAFRQSSSTFVLPTEEIGRGVKGMLDNFELRRGSDSMDELMGLDAFDYSNIALHKPVEVSGLEVDDGRWTGDMVVDGDTTTRVSFHYQDDAWLTVDLQDIYFINELQIHFVEHPAQYQVYVSVDGQTWNMVHEDLNCVEKSPGVDRIVLASTQQARYVRYQQVKMFENEDGRFFSGNFSEFEVYGAALGPAQQTLSEANRTLEGLTGQGDSATASAVSDMIACFEALLSRSDLSTVALASQTLHKQIADVLAGVRVEDELDTDRLKSLLLSPVIRELYSDSTYNSYLANYRYGVCVLLNLSSDQAAVDNAVDRILRSKAKLERVLCTVSSDREVYGDYLLENMLDGDIGTFAWTQPDQKEGEFILFTMKQLTPLFSLHYYAAPDGSDLLQKADVQVSIDGVNWTTVGSLDSRLDQLVTFKPVLARYARILITSSTPAWLKVSEVVFNESPDESILSSVAAEVKTLSAEDYTAVSYEKLSAAIDQAEELLERGGATNEEIQLALDQILDGLYALEPASSTAVSYGDINSDQAITATDALMALQHSVGLITLTPDQLVCGDVNTSGKIDATDALLILQYSVHLINFFPVEL